MIPCRAFIGEKIAKAGQGLESLGHGKKFSEEGTSPRERLPSRDGSPEDDGAIGMHQSAPIEMQPDGTTEDTLLEGPPFTDEVLNRITV